MPLCSVNSINDVYYCEEYSFRTRVFRDRIHAGELLGRMLKDLGVYPDMILGLALGGVPVAIEVARELGGCLDIIVAKKITYPWTTEAGFGAVTLRGLYVVDERVLALLGYDERVLSNIVSSLTSLVVERTLKLRGSLDYRVEGKDVLVVDDGIATGYTMLAAVKLLKSLGARTVMVATPTSSVDGALKVSKEASVKVYTINLRSGEYYAVADAYEEWHDVSEEEALEVIGDARRRNLLCRLG